MIFKPELAQLIINRRKTQTRRPVKPGVPCRYEPGKDYAVQPGRGAEAIDRILILDVHKETLGEVDHQAALAEGFSDFGEFIDYWEQLYCFGWRRRKVNGETVNEWVRIRGREIDLDQQVWVITFELHRPVPVVVQRKDRTRLLAERPAATQPYTGSVRHAAKDPNLPRDCRGIVAPEPEAIDPRIIKNLPSSLEAQQQWAKDRAWEAAAYRDLALEERLRRVRDLAAAKRVDITRQELSILRRIESIESKLRRAA